MPSQKMRRGFVHYPVVKPLPIVESIAAQKRIPDRGVEYLVDIFLALAGVAGVEIVGNLPCADCGYAFGQRLSAKGSL